MVCNISMKKSGILTTGILTALLVGGSIHEGLAQRRQNTRFIPYSEVGLGVGTSTYYGDLAGYRRVLRATYVMPRWNVGGFYTRHFTPNFSARASFTWARISGDDYTFNKNDPERYAAQFVRNLHFRNDLKEFAVTGMYNFIANGRNSQRRPKWQPYAFGGLALLAHSPEARLPIPNPDEGVQEWVKLQPLNTEGQGIVPDTRPYSLVTLAIPLGIGVRYRLNDDFNIGAEIGYRYTFNDYLDDVGGNYPPPGALTGVALQMTDRRLEPVAARKGEPRADVLQQIDQNVTPVLSVIERGARGRLQDSYLLTNISIHYVIPAKIKCPPIK